MSEITKPIMLDETGKEIVAAILSTDVAQKRIAEINTAAEAAKADVLASIPEDYTNLSERAVENTEKIGELSVDAGYYSDFARIENWTNNAYIAINGATADVTKTEYSATARVALIECKEGDLFTVNATGGNASRAYGFVAENGTIIETAEANTTVNATLSAPAGAKCRKFRRRIGQ